MHMSTLFEISFLTLEIWGKEIHYSDDLNETLNLIISSCTMWLIKAFLKVNILHEVHFEYQDHAIKFELHNLKAFNHLVVLWLFSSYCQFTLR